MDSTKELEKIYSNRFVVNEAQRNEVWRVLARYFERWINPTDTVVDIGAGYCEFINNVRAAQKYALDANPMTSLKAKKDVTVVPTDLKLEWPIRAGSVDVAFSSNFFEHLPTREDLKHCLGQIHRILRQNGLLICIGPNIRYAYREYWDFIDHYLPLSDRSLLECCEVNGFDEVSIVPRFLPYTMKNSRLPNRGLFVRLYLAVPAIWRFVGKQFLLIVRKR